VALSIGKVYVTLETDVAVRALALIRDATHRWQGDPDSVCDLIDRIHRTAADALDKVTAKAEGE
jgi:hypothetical protein